MNTPTHIFVAAAILARPNAPRRNWAVAAGAFVPDLSMFIFFFWATFVQGLSQSEIWRVAYWTEPWQTLGAISNSIPIALSILAVAIIRRHHLAIVFALALLTHAALDFPTHADDAHRHFWPISDWRFQSPLSYWDARGTGRSGAIVECGFLLAAAFFIWRRFPLRWVRISLALLTVAHCTAFAASFFIL
ncbi:MAG: hypothetical protein AAGC77_10545 [Pseudomonadota bacterium]